jgi:hypothetical protein
MLKMYKNGYKAWYIEDIEYTEDEYKKAIKHLSYTP